MHFVCAFLVQTVEYDASNAKDMASFCKNLNVKKQNISEQKHGGIQIMQCWVFFVGKTYISTKIQL